MDTPLARYVLLGMFFLFLAATSPLWTPLLGGRVCAFDQPIGTIFDKSSTWCDEHAAAQQSAPTVPSEPVAAPPVCSSSVEISAEQVFLVAEAPIGWIEWSADGTSFEVEWFNQNVEFDDAGYTSFFDSDPTNEYTLAIWYEDLSPVEGGLSQDPGGEILPVLYEEIEDVLLWSSTSYYW